MSSRLSREEQEFLSADLEQGLPHGSAGSDSKSGVPLDDVEVQRQLEAIESFHQEVTCHFEDVLSTGLQRIVEVELREVQSMTYSQFAFSRTNPTCFVVLQATPLPAQLALDFSPAFLYPVLDCLLGGGKHPCPIPNRPPTELEQRLARRVAQMLLGVLHDVWEPVLAVNLTVDRIESHAARVRLVAPSDSVVTLTYQGRVADQTGEFTMCLPSRAIRKMVDRLLVGEYQGVDSAIVPRGSADRDTVDLGVRITAEEMSSTDIDRLQVGDLIVTNVDAHGLVDVTVDGQVVYQGRPGAVDGHRAVLIESEPSA